MRSASTISSRGHAYTTTGRWGWSSSSSSVASEQYKQYNSERNGRRAVIAEFNGSADRGGGDGGGGYEEQEWKEELLIVPHHRGDLHPSYNSQSMPIIPMFGSQLEAEAEADSQSVTQSGTRNRKRNKKNKQLGMNDKQGNRSSADRQYDSKGHNHSDNDNDSNSNRIYDINGDEFQLEDPHLLRDINLILRITHDQPPIPSSSSSSHHDINPQQKQDNELKTNQELQRRRTITQNNITFRSNLQIKKLMEQSQRDSRHHNNNNHHHHHPQRRQRPKQQHRNHAHIAEQILDLLQQIHATDTIAYNTVINAYAKSNLPDSAQRAESILGRMERVHRDQLEALRCWEVEEMEEGMRGDTMKGGSGGMYAVHRRLPPPEVTVKPNVRTYSTVIDAYSRIAGVDSDAAEAAQSLLQHLSSLYTSSSSSSSESARDEELKPNIISYNTVLNAWAKTGTVHGAMMATKLLEEMEENTHSENRTDHSDMIGVDVISYNAVIHAWARCGSDDSGERAEKILRRMQRNAREAQEEPRQRDECEDDGAADVTIARNADGDASIVHPNTRTYSSVIDAWSRSDHPNAARRAHQILNEMENQYAQTGDINVRPNTVAYSTVINAHARSRDMERKARSALGVLKKMEKLYRSGENIEAKPTIVSYNSVLNTCASTYGLGSSGGVDTSSRTESGPSYQSSTPMIAGDECQPNYHQLLVLDIVKRLYHQIISPQSKVHADHFTYGTVLKACANLTSPRDGDDETLAFIRRVFSRCCDDGQVSFGVCFQLRQAVPTSLYRELIPPEAMDARNGHFVMSCLPPEWSRNVKEKKRFAGKRQ